MAIDWSKPETLKFRNWDAKILEIFVPKNPKSLTIKYPIQVFVEHNDGKINTETYTINGKYVIHEIHDRDIMQPKTVQLDFLDIVKLIQENKELVVAEKGIVANISQINIETKTFRVKGFDYPVEQLYGYFLYSIDDKKTWHKFEKLED